jgi:hypothetical protein
MKLRRVIVLGTGLLLVVAATRTVPAFFKTEKSTLSEKEKVSYALGMTVASQVRAQAIDVDPEIVTRAFKDALSDGKTLLTYQEARAVIARLQKEVKAKRAALQREKIKLRGRDAAAARAPSEVKVSYKLDPRLSGGVYGSTDRWVTIPSYLKVGEGKTCTLDVRVQGLDQLTWTAENPEMVTITPTQGPQVTLVVQHAGETRVHARSDAASKDFTIKAEYRNDVLQVEISHK